MKQKLVILLLLLFWRRRCIKKWFHNWHSVGVFVINLERTCSAVVQQRRRSLSISRWVTLALVLERYFGVYIEANQRRLGSIGLGESLPPEYLLVGGVGRFEVGVGGVGGLEWVFLVGQKQQRRRRNIPKAVQWLGFRACVTFSIRGIHIKPEVFVPGIYWWEEQEKKKKWTQIAVHLTRAKKRCVVFEI